VAVSTEPPLPSVRSVILSGKLTQAILAPLGPVRSRASELARRAPACSETPPPFRPPMLSDPSCCGARDHVGCHASRLMRLRIWLNRGDVKWLSANCRTKYRVVPVQAPTDLEQPLLQARQ
jgi:hypothetical protein